MVDNASNDIAPATAIKQYTAIDLWLKAWSKAGKALFYMQFLYPNWPNEQRQHVERMCYYLAAEHSLHFEDTEENREWFCNWIERFDDETENMC